METTLSFLKSAFFNILIISMIAYFIPNDSYAARGCCSRHGGVAGCNKSTGFTLCKDGTQSPSCKCSGTTTKSTSTKTTKTPVSTTVTTPTTTTTATTTAVPAAKEAAQASKRGCCKGHGGVASCDSKSGYQKCKDGTLSASCKCK